jgi:hypothetical protein
VNIAYADGHVKWVKSDEPYRQARACTDCVQDYGIGVVPIPTAASAWNPYKN